ncbi:MAG TPA: hypothetical protein VJS44_14370 [Pyrinomonadaceae bacterium]|nr:hypothetical protein [Pyrinomonadaceae bacterium]
MKNNAEVRMQNDELKREPDSNAPRSVFALLSSLSFFLLLACLCYYSILNSYFLSDDFVQVGRVLGGDWSLAWGREHGGFFRPLFIASYIVDSRVWGERPFGYHLTNALLHGLNSYLVYRLGLLLLRSQKLSEESARRVSLAAGLLFLLHPSHTEAVSWISGRADLLAALFCLAALLLYVFYVENRRAPYLLLALISFALALLSKEAAASLPFIIFAFGVYLSAAEEKRRAPLLRALKTSVLFFAVLLLFLLLRRVWLGAWLGGYGAEQHLNFSPGWIRDRFLQATLRAVVPAAPAELSEILLKPLKSAVFILVALVFMTLVLLLLRRRRHSEEKAARHLQNKLVLLLAVSFVLSLLPVISLRLSLFDTQGERFIYWPSVFTCLLISHLGVVLIKWRRWRLLLLACILVFYSVSLYRTNQRWREAGETARRIKEELALGASGEESLIVINAPDNLRGVPVFHNGLQEALSGFQKSGPKREVRLLSLHSIQSVADGAELKMEGDRFTLRLTNRSDVFTKVADTTPCFEVQERFPDALSFRLRGCPPRAALFFFNSGSMYRVIARQENGAGR